MARSPTNRQAAATAFLSSANLFKMRAKLSQLLAGGLTMTQSHLGELLQIAVTIMELDDLENELTDKSEWRAAKKQYEAQQEEFDRLRNEFVDGLLSGNGPHETIVDDVTAQIEEVRQRADPSWYPAIDYTSDNLLPYLQKEARKSPGLRKVQKAAPFVAGALVIIAYFGVRIFAATPVTESIDSRLGLQQRSAAAEKAIRYDDWSGTRVRRGGWLKGILFWPIEPTETEIQSAAEFVTVVLEGQQYAEGCGSVTGYGDSLSDSQIDMISEVADYIQDDSVVWEDPPVFTILRGLESASAC